MPTDWPQYRMSTWSKNYSYPDYEPTPKKWVDLLEEEWTQLDLFNLDPFVEAEQLTRWNTTGFTSYTTSNTLVGEWILGNLNQ